MSEADDVREIQELQRRLQAGEVTAGVRRLLAILARARKAILGEIAGTEWSRQKLATLQIAIDRELARFRQAALTNLTADEAASFSAGAQAVAGVGEAMGVGVKFLDLPVSLLQAMQQEAGARLRSLTDDARRRIDEVITTALLTGRPRHEAIEELGRVLDVSGGRGVFETVARRAAFIYQHEVGAVYARAQEYRRRQIAQYVPDLQQVWGHCGAPKEPRPGHVAMHGQVRDMDELFLNPVTGVELAYPRDPAAPISETANCGCAVFTYRREYGDPRAYACSGKFRRTPGGPSHLTREEDQFNPFGLVDPSIPVLKGR